MKFYGIDSINPIQLGTPSNDNSLTNLLAWDPSDGKVKYRETSSISGGGGSGSQNLSQVLNVGNDAGTYSIEFRGGDSEIYSIIAGTSFYQWSATMSSFLAITSSAFVFKPDTSSQLSGLSVLNSIFGAVAYDTDTNKSNLFWMCGRGFNKNIITKVCAEDDVLICSCDTINNNTSNISICHTNLNIYSGNGLEYGNILVQPNGIQLSVPYGPSSSLIYISNNSVDLSTQNSNGANCISITGDCVNLNGTPGTDGQVVSINSTGQLCWSTGGGGGGGSGSTILNACEVGFGTGTGITSSIVFMFDSSLCTLKSSYNSTIDGSSDRSVILGGENHNICNNSFDAGIIGGVSNSINYGSSESSIIGGCSNEITCYSYQSSIISGYNNTIYCSNNSTINGGDNSLVCQSTGSSIIGGQSHIVWLANNSVISGGYNNAIYASASFIGASITSTIDLSSSCSTILGSIFSCVIYGPQNSIIGGQSNTICSGMKSTIIGGLSNQITSYEYLGALQSNNSIIGGQSNLICRGSIGNCNSVIIGGNSNCLLYDSKDSVLIGGCMNKICGSCRAALIGGYNLSLSYACCTVGVPSIVTPFPVGTTCLTPPAWGGCLVVGDVYTYGSPTTVYTNQWLRININGAYVKLAIIP